MSRTVSIDRLRQLFHCDAGSGLLTWKVSRGRKRAGSPAGCLHKTLGYLVVNVDGEQFLAHRIVWAMTYSKWPMHFLDHIDGDRANNQIVNLRDVTQQINAQNRSKPGSHNKSGYLGVAFQKRTGMYEAQIKDADGKTHRLGSFNSPELAHEAYIEAKLELHEGVGAHIFNRKAGTTCLEEVTARMVA